MADAENPATNGGHSSSGSEQEKAANGQQQDSNKPDDKAQKPSKEEEKSDEPAGGFDSTPIAKTPPGWTIKFTFIRATNLPMADINTLSSDPYVAAELHTALPMRHKEDPPLRFRTQTIRRDTDPTWNSEWIVANVPSSGFRLKARMYDEDPADHDDRLGNVHVNVGHIDADWAGIKDQAYSIKKRMGSKRAYLVRAVATCVRAAKHMSGELHISIEVLGRTKDDNGGRCYTVGPTWWVKHYSPMLGRITGQKEDKQNESKPKTSGSIENGEKADGSAGPQDTKPDQSGSNDGKKSKSKTQRYNFQANQMQLPGPVPAELYHRYVEFKPFVHGMFTHSGLRGFLLNKALHHQHARVYNYDRSTLWGYIPADDPEALTKRFLELVHYDKGGKIFTYVLTLDAQLRFTETGKEFGIDMLSKHSMHSDVEIYIAFSGEFFIRRHHSKKQGNSETTALQSSGQGASASAPHDQGPDPSKPAVGKEFEDPTSDANSKDREGGEVATSSPVAAETKELDSASLDPSNYELIIDNDSGTYRPAAHLLPLLRLFLQRSFPGLHVRVLDCQKDGEKMSKLKDEQRERKKSEAGGASVVYAQRDRSDSLSSQSSSDDEELDALEGGGERRFRKQLVRDAQWRAGAHVRHLKGLDPRNKRGDVTGGQVEDEGQTVGQGQQQIQESEASQHDAQGAGHSEGPEELTEAERIAHQKGEDYDPKGAARDLDHGQGQPIGRSANQDVVAEAKS